MLKVGTEVAGYRIDGVLGRGGMGVVYEACQLALRRTVALKVLSAELGADRAFRQRFRREGEIQAGIDHPNIVTVYEAGEMEEGLFIAMRLVRGSTLKDLIIGRELEGARTIRLLRPIADALNTAHDAGLIHRDIKPQNILVQATDRPFLADFGLTKGLNESGVTRTGQFVGTIDYVSPEQIRGDPAGPASDIYALAAVLYECLTGVVPYPKPSDAAVLYAHMSEAPPSVTDQRPELPVALDAVVARAMSKDPRVRHASALELIEDAERAFGRRTRAVITPPGPIEMPEETGLRLDERKVPTSPSHIRPSLPDSPPDPDPNTNPDRERSPGRGEPSVAQSAARQETVGDTIVPQPTPVAGPPLAAMAETRTHERGLAMTVDEAAIAPPRAPDKGAPARAAQPGVAHRPAPGEAAADRHQSPPSTRPSDRRRRAGPLAAAAIAIVALGAAAGGFLAGRSSAPAVRPVAFADSIANQDIAFRHPAGWRRIVHPAPIAGLAFTDPISVAPGQPAVARVIAGQIPATGPDGARGADLLPAGFARATGAGKVSREPVRLGAAQAYRYRDLRMAGSPARLTLYAVPTTAGVATVVCSSTAAAPASFAAQCERVATTLTLVRGTAYPVTPKSSYSGAVNSTLGALARARSTPGARLRAARTASGQARAAIELASAYSRATSSLGRMAVSPAVLPEHRSMVASLRDTTSAFRQLALAARSGDSARYGLASGRVRRREAALQTATRALRGAGYAPHQ